MQASINIGVATYLILIAEILSLNLMKTTFVEINKTDQVTSLCNQ